MNKLNLLINATTCASDLFVWLASGNIASRQNTQDCGRWERCITNKIDYEAVGEQQREVSAQMGAESFREGVICTFKLHRIKAVIYKHSVIDWRTGRENQADIWRKNFPMRTAGAESQAGRRVTENEVTVNGTGVRKEPWGPTRRPSPFTLSKIGNTGRSHRIAHDLGCDGKNHITLGLVLRLAAHMGGGGGQLGDHDGVWGDEEMCVNKMVLLSQLLHFSSELN